MGILLQFSPGYLVLQKLLLCLYEGLMGELIECGAINSVLFVNIRKFGLKIFHFLEPLVDHSFLEIRN